MEEPSYLGAAIHIHDFLESNMVDENDRLCLRFRDGVAAHGGQPDELYPHREPVCTTGDDPNGARRPIPMPCALSLREQCA